MILLAWLFALGGAAWAFVVNLAGAMRTVPQLPWREAITAMPLPAIAPLLAAWRLAEPAADGRPWLTAGLPLALALLTLLFIAATYLGQPGGRR